MHTTLINHPRLHVSLTTGTEGPRFDPYSYDETTIRTPRGTLVLHCGGLAQWVTLNGKPIRLEGFKDEDHKWRFIRTHLVASLCGYTLQQLDRIQMRLASRCKRCGGKHFHHESGYPGETFTVCSACQHVNGSTFNLSAVA